MVRSTSELWTLIRDLLRPWTIRSGGWALIHSLSVLQTALPSKAAKAVFRYLLFFQYRPDDDLEDTHKVNVAVP